MEGVGVPGGRTSRAVRTELHAQGFDLLGTLKPNPQDGLADFVVLREPSPLEGPR